MLNTPFFEFIHPEDQEPTRKNIEALNLGLRSVGFENRYRAADGSYRTFSWSAAADEELGVRFASARDVTDERNFQNHVQQILDSIPFLLVVQDRKGFITNCNAAFAKSVGVSRESLIGQESRQYLSSVSVQTVLDKEQEVLKSRTAQTFEESLLKQGVAVKHTSTILPIFDDSGEITSLGKISFC